MQPTTLVLKELIYIYIIVANIKKWPQTTYPEDVVRDKDFEAKLRTPARAQGLRGELHFVVRLKHSRNPTASIACSVGLAVPVSVMRMV